MLAGKPNSAGRRVRIIRSLLFSKPAHQFHLDYHMCAAVGLEVREMQTGESDVTKDAVRTLGRLAREEKICLPITNDLQQPFIAFFPLAKQP